jgi:hypothetical protein
MWKFGGLFRFIIYHARPTRCVECVDMHISFFQIWENSFFFSTIRVFSVEAMSCMFRPKYWYPIDHMYHGIILGVQGKWFPEGDVTNTCSGRVYHLSSWCTVGSLQHKWGNRDSVSHGALFCWTRHQVLGTTHGPIISIIIVNVGSSCVYISPPPLSLSVYMYTYHILLLGTTLAPHPTFNAQGHSFVYNLNTPFGGFTGPQIVTQVKHTL